MSTLHQAILDNVREEIREEVAYAIELAESSAVFAELVRHAQESERVDLERVRKLWNAA